MERCSVNFKDVNHEQYDNSKFKLHASIQWVCSFIPCYHKDAVKNNVRENLDFLSLPPKTIAGNAVWRDIVALLVSCEAYRCASFAIFGTPAPTNHWTVIQTLARHGFYAVTEDGSGVIHTALLTANPFNQTSHLAVIDCLMQGYACKLVTIPRIVAVVRNIGPFNASQELPFDLEDSLVLWINKVCRKVSSNLNEAVETKKGSLKLGLVHPSSTPLPPNIPHIVDLIQDVGDGQCLGVLVHSYLPNDLPLSALKFGGALSQSDKAENLGALRFALMTALGACWFPLSIEMLLNPGFTTKPNVIVFISELFWKFEVGGLGRNQSSSESWLKEEAKDGNDMNCAAAATEISQHLNKFPVPLTEETGGGEKPRCDKASDDNVSQIDFKYLKSSPGRTPPSRTVITPRISTESRRLNFSKSPEPKSPEPQSRTPIPGELRRSQENGSPQLRKSRENYSPESRKTSESKSEKSSCVASPKNMTPEPQAVAESEVPPSEVSSDGVVKKYFREESVSTESPDPSSLEPSSVKISDTDVIAAGDDTQTKRNECIQNGRVTEDKEEQDNHGNVTARSGEDMVDDLKKEEQSKRDFYTNISKWVDSVNKESDMKMFESSEELTDHLHRTIDSHFSKSTKLTKASFVASSYTISKEDKEAARLRGLPVIPVTPAPADPQRIKEDYMLTVQERDDAIRKVLEEEERKKKEELEKKRALEEKLAEERRQLEEMSDASSKSGGKKGKKGGKGARKGAEKEGKSFPRRPASAGSNSSAASSKSAKGKAGAKGKKIKDDMAVKSEKVSRSKSVSGKGDAGGPKRRVKSARRAGKSVSFMDESNLHPPVPAIDLVPKEEIIPDAECPFKKDTRVIGEDRKSKKKLAYFVPLSDVGLGVGAGPVLEKTPRLSSGWEDDQSSLEDSLQAMRNSDSNSESESDGEEEEEEEEEEKENEMTRENSADSQEYFNHILASLSSPNKENVVTYELLRDTKTPTTPPPADSKQLLLRLHMLEKRKNIEKYRKESTKKWEDERSLLNQHVFYKALKTSRDVGQQASSKEIESELERTDSLEKLIPHAHQSLYSNNVQKQCWDKIEQVTAEALEKYERESRKSSRESDSEYAPSLTEPSPPIRKVPKTPQSLSSTPSAKNRESLSSTPAPLRTEQEDEQLSEAVIPSNYVSPVRGNARGTTGNGCRRGTDSQLVAVFNDYENLLSTQLSPGERSTSASRKPTAMQYFYGLEETEPDDKISLKRQQFFVTQKKKQEEIKARKELEQQRKLQAIRSQAADRPEGNLVTKCPRPKSSRIRVVKFVDDSKERSVSAGPAVVMSCRTPTHCSTQSYEDENRVMRPIRTGGVTYRKVPKPESLPEEKKVSESRKTVPQKKLNKPLSGAKCNGKQFGSPGSGKLRTTEKSRSNPIRPPALPLFVAPSAKSNSKVICNAVCWTCLSGVPDKPQQKLAIQAIHDNPAQQYVILFRDHIAKKFRAIYTCDNTNAKLIRIFGQGPKTIYHPMISHLYKYETGARSFSDIQTLTFSLSVDAVTIKNELWRRAGVNPC